MGHSYCCHYANIFMAKWEKEALEKCPLLPLLFLRFLDDIFIIWTHGKEEFLKFFDILNNHLDCIKLTYTYDEISSNFLDVTVFKGQQFDLKNILDTKLYFKPTDSHLLLHSESYHPRHIFRSIVKSQVIRFHRICSNTSDFNDACSTLFTSLRSRHYSKRFLRRIKNEVVTNLTNLPASPLGKSQPCHSDKCQKCPFILETNFVRFNAVNFEIRQPLDCDSTGIIYIIHCLKCDMIYVGETGNKARTRFNQHLSDIRLNKNTPVAEHFNSCRHDVNTDLKFIIIQQISSQKYRKYRESILIKLFNSEVPLGMNIRTDDMKRYDVIMPIVIPFGEDSSLFTSKLKDLCQQHNATNRRIITAFKRHKTIGNFLSITKN